MRKKSIRYATRAFETELDQIEAFLLATAQLPDQQVSWSYDFAVIRLYRGFESLMLHTLVGVLNNDTATASSHLGITLPKHLTDEVCQFLVIGSGYFDFKGRDGLIAKVRQFVPEKHWLVLILKKPAYKVPLTRLAALRNFASHTSDQAKRAAKDATGQQRISSAGSWLKRQNRFQQLARAMRLLANDIHAAAPR